MPSKLPRIRALISLSLVMAAILSPSSAQACKDRIYPASFPLEELDRYAHVYIVRVNQLTYNEPAQHSRYTQPFSFKGTVLRTIKGPRQAGEIIEGATTSGENAHARCPISLEAGKTYLLMLNGSGSAYALPRYGSLFLSSEQPEFEGYLADLTKQSQ